MRHVPVVWCIAIITYSALTLCASMDPVFNGCLELCVCGQAWQWYTPV
jgi:hypothetical protein